jgi:hypothetical protein
MYRIELAPGEEAIFKSMDEMVTGIRGGLIKDDARIWHKSTEKWLPIEFHPHYKLAKEKVATGVMPAIQMPSLRLDPKQTAKPATSAAPAAASPAAASPAAATASRTEPSSAPLTALASAPASASPADAAAVPAIVRLAQSNAEASPPLQPSIARHAPEPLAAEAPAILALGEPDADDAPVATATLPEAEFISLDSHAGTADDKPLGLEPLAPSGRRRIHTIGLIGGLAVVAVAGGAWVMHRSPSSAPARPAAHPRETTTTFAGSAAATAAAAPNAEAPAPTSSIPPSTLPDDPAPGDRAARLSADAGGDSIVPAVLPRPTVSAGPISGTIPTESAGSPSAATPAGFAARYAAAAEKARNDFEKQLGVFGFGNVFSTSRLGAGDGVPATRTAINAADNLLRNFRKQSDAIERAYRDSLDAVSHRANWTPEQIRAADVGSQAEGGDVQLVASSILKATDAVFDLLAAQAGQYKVSGGTISFEDPQAARDYGALRQQIQQLLVSKSAAGNTSAGRLAKAIGTARLPVEN